MAEAAAGHVARSDCERIRTGLVAQPVNTLSSLAYVAVAVPIWRAARRAEPERARSLGAGSRVRGRSRPWERRLPRPRRAARTSRARCQPRCAAGIAGAGSRRPGRRASLADRRDCDRRDRWNRRLGGGRRGDHRGGARRSTCARTPPRCCRSQLRGGSVRATRWAAPAVPGAGRTAAGRLTPPGICCRPLRLGFERPRRSIPLWGCAPHPSPPGGLAPARSG